MANKELKVDLNINLDSLTELEKIVARIEEQLKSISKTSFKDVVNGIGAFASAGSFVIGIVNQFNTVKKQMGKIAKAIDGEKATIETAAKKLVHV